MTALLVRWVLEIYRQVGRLAGRPNCTPTPLVGNAPVTDWRTHWTQQGQPWRTEPGIFPVRQKEIACCLHAAPSDFTALAPAHGLRLSRADIEWLLAARADGASIDLRGVNLRDVDLSGLDLSGARLEGADCRGTSLRGASLQHAFLRAADLSEAHLEGAHLQHAHLEGTRLCGAFFDASTSLDSVLLYSAHEGAAVLADVRWGGANITAIDWTALIELGDEEEARRRKTVAASRIALRACRQIATVLRDQGMHEEADPLAYRALRLKRKLLAWQVLRQVRNLPASRRALRLALLLRRGHAVRRTVGVLAGLIAPFLLLLMLQAQLSPPVLVGFSVLALLLLLLGIPVIAFPVLPQIVAILVGELLLLMAIQGVCGLLLLLLFEATLYPLIQQVPGLPLGAQILVLAIIALLVLAPLLMVMRPLQIHVPNLPHWLDLVLHALPRFFLYEGHLLRVIGMAVGGMVRFGFALFLEVVSGYGYKPERCVLWYVMTLLGFTWLYVLVGQPLAWDTAFLSLTAFHGRGFFPGTLPHPGELVIALAALEAVMGLFLEISFIAAFSQRYFGK